MRVPDSALSRVLLMKSNSFYRPVRTFNTAVVYYHKFRLVHAESEYMFGVSLFGRLVGS